VDAEPENAERVMRALAGFGAPLADVTAADFARPGVVLQIGVPPGRIDVLTDLTALQFADAWTSREPGRFGSLTVDFLGKDAFIRSKRATGRARDLGDIEGRRPVSISNRTQPKAQRSVRASTTCLRACSGLM